MQQTHFSHSFSVFLSIFCHFIANKAIIFTIAMQIQHTHLLATGQRKSPSPPALPAAPTPQALSSPFSAEEGGPPAKGGWWMIPLPAHPAQCHIKASILRKLPAKTAKKKQKKSSCISARASLIWIPATSYSPGPCPAKYHRR